MKEQKTPDYYMSLPYKMEITPDTAECGYIVSYPDLPGCITCADTLEKAIANAEDCKKEWLTAAIEDGVEIKEP
jgi:predicted RNase H-like HicB family nuclease